MQNRLASLHQSFHTLIVADVARNHLELSMRPLRTMVEPPPAAKGIVLHKGPNPVAAGKQPLDEM